jgi:hypothetical protein
LSEQLLGVGFTSAEILEGIIARIVAHCVTSPEFAAMYASLCRKISDSNKITPFPTADPAKQLV